MNNELNSHLSPDKIQFNAGIEINLDEFNIGEDSFKPINKGLGFHHKQEKSPTVRTAAREKSKFAPANQQKTVASLLNNLSKSNQNMVQTQAPTGLEAFYSASSSAIAPAKIAPEVETSFLNKATEEKIEKVELNTAPMLLQLAAWSIDFLVVLSFVAVTIVLLVLASGIPFPTFIKLISLRDQLIFSASLFSIYYVLYFTILDLSTSPGKIICGLKLIKANGEAVSVKNTFLRSLVTLLSILALCLPNLLDFQGLLSDSKVVK